MATMTHEELAKQTARRLAALARELDGMADEQVVERVGTSHLQRLVQHATITDFIPLLVYRCTKDELMRGAEVELVRSA